MPRRKKEPSPETPKTETNTRKVRAALGHNIPPETLKKHYAAVGALKVKLRALQGDLSAAWKAAEADGIDKKAGKLVFGLFDLDPATADLFMRSVTQYATQLGLFDKIDSFKAAEEQEANRGSVDRAESDLKKPPSGATAEPTSGGRGEAIYAQGFEAGKNGAAPTACPSEYETDDANRWYEGFHAGALQRVDAHNSELASVS